MEMDGWMEMQMQLKLGRCLPVCQSLCYPPPPLTGIHLFEVLAPDSVRSPIWLPFKSDQIKMREKFTSLLHQTFSYGYLFLVAGTPYLSGNCLQNGICTQHLTSLVQYDLRLLQQPSNFFREGGSILRVLRFRKSFPALKKGLVSQSSFETNNSYKQSQKR